MAMPRPRPREPIGKGLGMRMNAKHRVMQRIGLTSVAGAAALVAVGAVTVAMLAGASGAATNVAPKNTGEPSITGTPRVGQALRATRGTWSGTHAIYYDDTC